MKNLSYPLASRWSLLVVLFVGCILSCEESYLTTHSLQKTNELVTEITKENPPPLPEGKVSVTTCATDRDRKTCDTDFNGYCECSGSNCSQYCHDELPYTLLRLIERGRICGSTSGCLVPNIEQLILTFHVEKLTQPLSVLMTEKNEIFAKSRLLDYDEKTRIATIGYEMVNAELAKSELFIQINANFINEAGKFTSLNLLSEAIPPGHFQNK